MPTWQGGRDGGDILDIVTDAAAMERASPFAFAMRAKTQRMRRIAAGGEMVEEEFVPALVV
jgi:hypothetical protein